MAEAALRSALRGASNAVVYGAQVRLPHVLIMAALTRGRKGFLASLRLYARLAGRQTGLLAAFVALYRGWVGLGRRLLGAQAGTAVTAAAASALVYATMGPDDVQLLLFLLARVLGALATLSFSSGLLPKPPPIFSRLLRAAVGALILWLFEHHSQSLTPSLRAAMKFLYRD